MPDSDDDPPLVLPEQLRIGLYVHIDLPWTDHPFTFNSFKIRTQAQLDTLRALEVERFRYDPRKSDCMPLPVDDTPAAAPARPTPPPPSPETLAALAEKRARIERMNTIRRDLDVVVAEVRCGRGTDRRSAHACGRQPARRHRLLERGSVAVRGSDPAAASGGAPRGGQGNSGRPFVSL